MLYSLAPVSSAYVVPISQVRFELQCLGLCSADEFTASVLNFVERFSFEATLLQMLLNLSAFAWLLGRSLRWFFFFFFLIFSACSLSPVAVLRILIAVASLVAVHGL